MLLATSSLRVFAHRGPRIYERVSPAWPERYPATFLEFAEPLLAPLW